MIRIDDEAYEMLRNLGKTGDSFNGVIRRLLGLEKKERQISERKQIKHDDDELDELFSVINKYLPNKWAESPMRMKQILWTVVRFLKQPRSMPVTERRKYATRETAIHFNVESSTVHAKCGREIYGVGDQLIGKFEDALENIERDYRKING